MGHTLVHPVRISQCAWRRTKTRASDPLDAMRGVVCATLISVLAFWIPLAVALAQ
jgi:hypothetical protein